MRGGVAKETFGTENIAESGIPERTVMIKGIAENNMISERLAEGSFPSKVEGTEKPFCVRPFQKGNEDSGHFGMGLYICDLLCRKHGGSLKVQNIRSGTSVCAVLKGIYVTVQTDQ